MRYTLGYIRHNEEIFNKYLGRSIEKIENSIDVISHESSTGYPSSIYNRIIDDSKNRYIILTHEDINFNENLINQIDKTINTVGDFGVIGLVGKLNNGKITWSSESRIYEYITVDCCFFIIDKYNNIRFDELTFDELHKYAEDYAMQCIDKGLINYSILSKCDSPKKEISHMSHTCRTVGYKWGKWSIYHKLFNEKWKGKI
jgi:hypothetical protein